MAVRLPKQNQPKPVYNELQQTIDEIKMILNEMLTRPTTKKEKKNVQSNTSQPR